MSDAEEMKAVLVNLDSTVSPWNVQATADQMEAAAKLMESYSFRKCASELRRLKQRGGLPLVNVIERDLLGDVLLSLGALKAPLK